MSRAGLSASAELFIQNNLGKPVAEHFHSGFYWELRMMEVVVITGAIVRAKLQSNH